MELKGLNVGFAICGSFCTIEKCVKELETLKNEGCNIYPIMSVITKNTDNRFNKADELCRKVEEICERKIISSITGAEPIGPKKLLDAVIVAPCTGNTLAKLALGITDTPVTMAVKASLRNNCPIVIGISTNDGLTNSAKNIGTLLNTKNIFFVPFGQDDPINKPTSLVAHMEYIKDTLKLALNKEQIQPVIR